MNKDLKLGYKIINNKEVHSKAIPPKLIQRTYWHIGFSDIGNFVSRQLR